MIKHTCLIKIVLVNLQNVYFITTKTYLMAFKHVKNQKFVFSFCK